MEYLNYLHNNNVVNLDYLLVINIFTWNTELCRDNEISPAKNRSRGTESIRKRRSPNTMAIFVKKIEWCL